MGHVMVLLLHRAFPSTINLCGAHKFFCFLLFPGNCLEFLAQPTIETYLRRFGDGYQLGGT